VSEEYENEPTPGLPGRLPEGETLLWQGSPDWRSFARRALYADLAALYTGLVAIWAAGSAYYDGATWQGALVSAGLVTLAGAIGIGILMVLAWLIARSTIYSLTTQRLVMRFGVALPMAFNIPYRSIASADAKIYGDGTGEISVRTAADSKRLGFVPMWPHVRAWRFMQPEPSLRCIPDAVKVANVLAGELASIHGTERKGLVEAPRVAVQDGTRPGLGSQGAAAPA
jgi:hypothetical protein